MGVFFAAPDANVASSASKLSCLSVTAEPAPPTRRSSRDATAETTQTHTHRYAVDATTRRVAPERPQEEVRVDERDRRRRRHAAGLEPLHHAQRLVRVLVVAAGVVLDVRVGREEDAAARRQVRHGVPDARLLLGPAAARDARDDAALAHRVGRREDADGLPVLELAAAESPVFVFSVSFFSPSRCAARRRSPGAQHTMAATMARPRRYFYPTGTPSPRPAGGRPPLPTKKGRRVATRRRRGTTRRWAPRPRPRAARRLLGPRRPRARRLLWPPPRARFRSRGGGGLARGGFRRRAAAASISRRSAAAASAASVSAAARAARAASPSGVGGLVTATASTSAAAAGAAPAAAAASRASRSAARCEAGPRSACGRGIWWCCCVA